jgi:hypothetical protein
MVVDELEERATDVPAPATFAVRRAFEVLAVGLTWALPGALLGLLAAALASAWPDYTIWFGVFGTLFGGAAGVWLEAASEAWDLPTI